MTIGIKLWDASGNVLMDENTRLPRIVGQLNSGTSGGSITNSGFATGTPFAVLLPLSTTYMGYTLPIVTFSGNTMNWTACNTACLIFYEVY